MRSYTLGIIPARGGSKRIPRKNIRMMAGKPLIAWTIEAAHWSLLDAVIVSTDDDEIRAVAQYYGAWVPFLRPKELATDEAKTIDVVRHALAWYFENRNAKVDAVAVLQPTSPTRTASSINDYLHMYERSGHSSLITVKRDGNPTGEFYIASKELVWQTGKLYDDSRVNVLQLRWSDIDTEEDWSKSEQFMKERLCK